MNNRKLNLVSFKGTNNCHWNFNLADLSGAQITRWKNSNTYFLLNSLLQPWTILNSQPFTIISTSIPIQYQIICKTTKYMWRQHTAWYVQQSNVQRISQETSFNEMCVHVRLKRKSSPFDFLNVMSWLRIDSTLKLFIKMEKHKWTQRLWSN